MKPLTLRIVSFSYKKGPLELGSEHGGGFVYDCRCLPNPGREERFKVRTGYEADVIEYLEKAPEVGEFYAHVLAISEQAVMNYTARSFESLSIAFGCTGGQHRSVYFANRLARDLSSRFAVVVQLWHRELGRSETFTNPNTERR